MTQYKERPELEEPVGSVERLVQHLRGGEKPRDDWRVGTEHEKVGLLRDGFGPLPYDGEVGIGTLLRKLTDVLGGTPVEEAGKIIALTWDGASLTLEPGGQLELSGKPLRTIHETCQEFHDHLKDLKRLSGPMGIIWLGLGINPFHPVEGLPRMPKQRYRVMSDYLPTRGDLALEMMHMTATVQANFDYSDEEDMARKMRMALAATPVISALFANSSLVGGKDSGFISRRMHIWRHTDRDRTGILPFVFEPGFGYARYVEWALDIPVFFIVRDGQYVPLGEKTFRRFIDEGHEGHQATVADFDLHLTTLFPDVRLKRVIEIRGADAVPPGLTCSLPAIWKGILYDPDALDAAQALTAPWTAEVCEATYHDVARRGLRAELDGTSVLELAREFTDIAGEGLRRLGHLNSKGEDERRFLDAIREQLVIGKSPGQVVIDRWEGEWGRSPERLIEYARY